MITLLRKTALRWALVYLLLFGITAGAVLGFVYWRTAGLITDQTHAAITADMVYFAGQYNEGGPEKLLEAVSERAQNTAGGVFQLTDFTGRPLAGNLRERPEFPPGKPEFFEFTYEAEVAGGFSDHPVRAQVAVLSGGLRLLAGRDIKQLYQVQAFMRQALGLALALALLLGLASGYLMSRNMLRRIEHMNRTSQAIRGGQLDERIPLTGSGDEFDTLARELNTMLDQNNRLMGEMRQVTDNIAHDLKTPLMRLQAGLEDGLRSGEDKTSTEAMQAAVREASGMLDIVNVLLSISRAEAGAGRDQMQEVELASLLQELAELYEPAAEEAGIRLKTVLNDEVMIKLNRQIISQAVSNLLDNAINHAAPDKVERGPEISLELALSRQRVEIIIADNGPGIAAKNRERVIERFVRLDASRSRPGAGLGLSIVAAAARLHEGEFRLEDNSPGLRAVISLSRV